MMRACLYTILCWTICLSSVFSQQDKAEWLEMSRQYLETKELDDSELTWLKLLSHNSDLSTEILELGDQLFVAFESKGAHRRSAKVYQHLLNKQRLHDSLRVILLQKIGAKFNMTNEVDSARHYLLAAKQSSLQYDSFHYDFILSSIGLLETKSGNYSKALEYYLEFLNIPALTPRDTHRWVGICIRTAKLFKLLENKPNAEAYLEQGVQLARTASHDATRLTAYRMAGIYLEDDNPALAIDYFKRAEALIKGKRKRAESVSIYTNLANCYLELDSLGQAERYLDLAQPLVWNMGSSTPKSNYQTARAKLFFLKGDFESSKRMLSELPDKVSSNIELRKSQLVKLIALEENEYATAFSALQREKELEDSLYQIRNNQIIFNLEEKYQNAEKEKQIFELSREKQAQEYEIEHINFLLLFLSIILGIILIFAFWVWRLYKAKVEHAQIISKKNIIIEQALRDKEYLMKEIHHRVKNNLQVISSLFSLQSNYTKNEDALKAINESRDRIKSMTLIHQSLYQKDNMRGVNVRNYFERLAQSLFNSYHITDQRIELEMEIDDMMLDLDTIMPIGLILNELISNSLKYAFPDGQSGMVKIRLKEGADGLLLQVIDNGVGFDVQEVEDDKESFGMEMIRAFLVKLEASIKFKNESGTQVDLLIKQYDKS